MSLLEKLGLSHKKKAPAVDWQANRAMRRKYKKVTGQMPPAKHSPLVWQNGKLQAVKK